jgi:hypothetical protein
MDARGETGPPAQSRARATYESDVSKRNAFASLSLFLPRLSSSSTTAAPPLTLLSNVRLLKTSRSTELDAASAVSRALSLFPSRALLLVVRLRRARDVFSALCPGRDAHTPIARRVRGVCGVRERPARASASDRQPPPLCQSASAGGAAGPCNLPARAPSSSSRLLLNAPCTLLRPPSASVLLGTLSSSLNAAGTLPPPAVLWSPAAPPPLPAVAAAARAA